VVIIGDQTTDVSSFVTRFYQSCLGKCPDPAKLVIRLINLIFKKVTGRHAAYGFIFSEEL